MTSCWNHILLQIWFQAPVHVFLLPPSIRQSCFSGKIKLVSLVAIFRESSNDNWLTSFHIQTNTNFNRILMQLKLRQKESKERRLKRKRVIECGSRKRHVYLHLTVLPLQGISNLVERNKHVLDDMILMVVVSDGFTLSSLKQRNLGWHHPAEEKPEPKLISKW